MDENSCDSGDLMSLQSLVFKNGHLIDSFCSGIDYCFRAKSSESDACVENIKDWRGSDIEILQNGIPIGEFPSGFTDLEICVAISLVDIDRDIFELRPIGSNGVCITGSGLDWHINVRTLI